MTAKTKQLKAKKQTATSTKDKTAAAGGVCAGNNGFPLISNEKLLSLYAAMLKCRMIEERLHRLFPKSKVFTKGQEAMEAGVIVDLLPEDALVASHRDLLSTLVKGVPLDKILSQVLALATNRSAVSSRNSHSPSACFAHEPLHVLAPSAPLASRLNIAADLALGYKLKNNGKIVVVLSGIEPGGRSGSWLRSWLKALHFAGQNSLPMLFVDQNNLPAGKNQQIAARHIALNTQSLSFPSIPVDGNDVVAIYRVASESISRIRQGRGPTLIDCHTYSLSGRPPARVARLRGSEVAECEKTNDAIQSMENYLARKGLFSREFQEQVIDRFSNELDAAKVMGR